jgi:hypothetical protein
MDDREWREEQMRETHLVRPEVEDETVGEEVKVAAKGRGSECCVDLLLSCEARVLSIGELEVIGR